MVKESDSKLYYSIGEVSRIAGVDAHVLRYWETEFTELSPHKNRGGNRAFTKSDIQIVLKIKELLYDERYTIEGAKRRLKVYKSEGDDRIDGVSELYLKTFSHLENIRKGLHELKDLLDGK